MATDRYNAAEAQARMERVKAAGKNIYFAWAGVVEFGGPHYYRVQSPSFMVEYDCTQDKANHIHSVWRDFDGDWGMDVLKEHYKRATADNRSLEVCPAAVGGVIL
jgi:hypothetical protein